MDGKAYESVLQSQIDDLKKQLAESGKANKVLGKQLAGLSKAKRPVRTKPARRSAKGYLRVIIADTHGSFMDRDAWAACMGDLKTLDIQEVVLLGDHVDCSGFLSAHQGRAYADDADYSYATDIQAANQWLDELQEVCPNAKYYMCQGNHEARLEKWVAENSLAHSSDRQMLMEALDPEFRLDLKGRGIKYFRRGEFNDTCEERGVIKLGKCHFIHEVAGGQNAARTSLAKFGASVVFGHTHRADCSYIRTPGTGVIMSANPGCLTGLNPKWMHSRGNTSSWTHGYALQHVRPDGGFMHTNVQIIDGKSMLIPLK
jgi:predicted phosphodiesterase